MPHLASPPTLQSRAIADLRFIRETMVGAASYTAFSGWGLIIIGLGALATGFAAARESNLGVRLGLWLVDAGVSILVGTVSSVLKARTSGQPLSGAPIRRFQFSFLPAILAGAVLTFFILPTAAAPLLPGLWLLLYGAALAAAGTQSVRAIPFMGAGFFALGTLALAGPPSWSNAILTSGFAGIHVAGGLVISRRHGG